jgi:hypothetical protein
LKIAFSLFLSVCSLCLSAQDNLVGKWAAQSILLRNHEIKLERKEKYFFKKTGAYVHRYNQYRSKGDTAKEVLFTTTFFNGKRWTVVKDAHGNVLRPRRVKERGNYKVDAVTKQIAFSTHDDRIYFKVYDLDNRYLYMEESTEGMPENEDTVYLLKLRRRSKIFSSSGFSDLFASVFHRKQT